MAYSERYWNIPPDKALNENHGNFAIPNQEIKSLKIKHKQEAEQSITEIRIESAGKKDTYNIDGYNKNIQNMLRSVFGDRAKT